MRRGGRGAPHPVPTLAPASLPAAVPESPPFTLTQGPREGRVSADCVRLSGQWIGPEDGGSWEPPLFGQSARSTGDGLGWECDVGTVSWGWALNLWDLAPSRAGQCFKLACRTPGQWRSSFLWCPRTAGVRRERWGQHDVTCWGRRCPRQPAPPAPRRGPAAPEDRGTAGAGREPPRADHRSRGPGGRKRHRAGRRATPHLESCTHLLRLLGQVEPIPPAELDQPLQVPPCFRPQ